MNAKPIGASLSSVASSAESEISMPDTRGFGTDVPVLTANTPHPCERVPWRVPWKAPSCSLRTHEGQRQQLAIQSQSGGRRPPALLSRYLRRGAAARAGGSKTEFRQRNSLPGGR